MKCPGCGTNLAFAAMFEAATDCIPTRKCLQCLCPVCRADFALEIRGSMVSLGRLDSPARAFLPSESEFVTCLQAFWTAEGAEICFAGREWTVVGAPSGDVAGPSNAFQSRYSGPSI